MSEIRVENSFFSNYFSEEAVVSGDNSCLKSQKYYYKKAKEESLKDLQQVDLSDIDFEDFNYFSVNLHFSPEESAARN